VSSIGRYEIEAEIGRGAMGVVYLAHDPRLGRRVAVKTYHVPEGFSDEQRAEFRQRFVREAQAAARLSHPAIVTIFDAEEGGDEGRPWISMEFVPGLRSRSEQVPVPWIESFGNEHDLVARLGMLAPRQRQRGIRIDGPVYRQKGAWGHLLNEHYLLAIADHLSAPERVQNPYLRFADDGEESPATPRLYSYFAGGQTSPY